MLKGNGGRRGVPFPLFHELVILYKEGGAMVDVGNGGHVLRGTGVRNVHALRRILFLTEPAVWWRERRNHEDWGAIASD